MKTLFFAAAALAAVLMPAAAATLPPGTPITGSSNGVGLLGLDSGFAELAGSETTALAPDDLEYLTRDFQIAVDFFADGTVRFYDNGGLGELAGTTTLEFSFAGLATPITGFVVADLSALTGGTVTSQVLGPQRIAITLNDLHFAAPFDSFTATVAVPEPASWLLFGAGLAVLRLRRRG